MIKNVFDQNYKKLKITFKDKKYFKKIGLLLQDKTQEAFLLKNILSIKTQVLRNIGYIVNLVIPDGKTASRATIEKYKEVTMQSRKKSGWKYSVEEAEKKQFTHILSFPLIENSFKESVAKY